MKTGTHAEESYSSPWEEKILAANGSDRAGLTQTWEKPCLYLKSDSTDDKANWSPCLEEISADLESRAVCEARSCEPAADTLCVFPFKVRGKTYHSCTFDSAHRTNYKPWCSTNVTEDGFHRRKGNNCL